VPRDSRQRRRVAKQHRGPPGLDPRDELVEPRIRHFERRQKLRAQHPIAPLAHAVLRIELDR
jgi:hypothetical protein